MWIGPYALLITRRAVSCSRGINLLVRCTPDTTWHRITRHHTTSHDMSHTRGRKAQSVVRRGNLYEVHIACCASGNVAPCAWCTVVWSAVVNGHEAPEVASVYRRKDLIKRPALDDMEWSHHIKNHRSSCPCSVYAPCSVMSRGCTSCYCNVCSSSICLV